MPPAPGPVVYTIGEAAYTITLPSFTIIPAGAAQVLTNYYLYQDGRDPINFPLVYSSPTTVYIESQSNDDVSPHTINIVGEYILNG